MSEAGARRALVWKVLSHRCPLVSQRDVPVGRGNESLWRVAVDVGHLHQRWDKYSGKTFKWGHTVSPSIALLWYGWQRFLYCSLHNATS